MTDPIRPVLAEQPTAVIKLRPSWIKGLSARALDLLLPPLCLVCQTRVVGQDTLCGGCWREVRFIRHPLCDHLGIPLPFDTGGRQRSAGAVAEPPDYDRARAVAHFTGSMRTLIHRLKYNDRHEARVLLGRWLTAAGQEFLVDADMIIPVPLNRRRLLWRKFNQAALLGLEVSGHTGVPMQSSLLVRSKATPPQVGLTEPQRRLNVQGAFRVPPAAKASIAGRNIVLIDDVITTGATVNACARALKRAGAARVDVLTLGLMTDAARAMR
jgi:ComF family protein